MITYVLFDGDARRRFRKIAKASYGMWIGGSVGGVG